MMKLYVHSWATVYQLQVPQACNAKQKSNAMNGTVNKIKTVLINLLEVDNTLKHENARNRPKENQFCKTRQFFFGAAEVSFIM